MELVTFTNPSRLSAINDEAVKKADGVEAAIAYASDADTLVKSCFDLDVQLKLSARYDYTQPVSVPILEKFLYRRSPNFVFQFVPDVLHAKVIWWHGVGAYIGSANLSSSAWFRNIEAGVFLTEDDLDASKIRGNLVSFFEEIDCRAYPLTRELLAEVERFTFKDPLLSEQQEAGRKRFDAARILPKVASLISITKIPTDQRRRDEFTKEWLGTLETLRMIASRVTKYRPVWIDDDVPSGAQADQFLHAYYYQQVRDGAAHPFREFYARNKHDPERALVDAMQWWQKLPSSPGSEAEMLHKWLPLLQSYLSKESLPKLSRAGFIEVVARVHAMRDHSNRVSWQSLGLAAPLPAMTWDGRARFFGGWLFDQHAPNGDTVVDALQFVLYGGSLDETPDRIFRESFTQQRKIPHLGVSSFGETVGWVHPDYSPPRNNRTSKALVALGFNHVRVHGDAAG